MITTNTKVKTPFGEGVVQGGFEVRQGDSALRRVLVRVKISEENRHLLGASSCMTPNANVEALFVVAESELT